MKKFLLLSLFVAPLFSGAQVLQTENFNSLTVGNLSANILGSATGQGSYYVDSSNGAAPTTSTNANATNVQIVSGGNASLGLQLVGPDGDKGARFIWKDGLPALWTSRTSGNNIIEIEVDINPGDGNSTSRNTFGVYIYNSDFTRTLAGFNVRAATRELSLVAYSTPTGNPVGNYSYSLAAAPGIQLPANTFSRIGISYNKTTGQVRIKGPGIAVAGLTVAGSSLGSDPAEVDFVAFSGHAVATPNLVAATMAMDNLSVKAAATDSLLGVNEFANESSFLVYPNPVDNVVSITGSSNNSINSIDLFDVNGRIVKSTKVDDLSNVEMNVTDLSSGIYMMKITSNQGTVTKKIVKQ